MSQEQERDFLNEQGVQVTNSRFILPGQTFAMSGITSVKSGVDKPSRTWPYILIGLGILTAISGGEAIGVGIFMTVLGALWFYLQKTTYHVILSSASGEAKALSSQDHDWVAKIVNALNESIVHRG